MQKSTKIAFLIGAIALLAGGTLGFVLGRRRKGGYSNFTGAMNSVFTIENTTAQPQTIKLFNSFQRGGVPAGVNVNSTVNAEEFKKMLSVEPKLLGSITVRSFTKNTQMTQLNSPLNINCKDSNGQAGSESLVPMSGMNSFRDDMATAAPSSNLIFDGKCYISYTIQPQTKVSLNFQWLPWQKQPSKSKNVVKGINGGIDMNTGLSFGDFPISVKRA